MDIRVNLPKGYVLYGEDYQPSEPEIISGERTSLVWSRTNMQGPLSVSVKYVSATDNSWIYVVLIVLLLGIGAVAAVYYRRKVQQALLRGFREDEQKVILFLQENRVIGQNKIQHEFDFSRAKITRIVKKLEEKGLIRKESMGRSNKLYWLK